ncbi:LOW QUALITY PROTEIN: hypothetical protein BC936DRAFT_147688 [Jimgerdemannia flammicorona]|uniref:Uncharacterized protein n=1 Tax=Jimgerdemannia flammicorona TaxID=994334 RepID=A0A433D4R7_9FUNG|nr:LOW QUALITY PROTEIN: hypothetical protein BC936DRAFT_147688 [Jimgerdemannia flammicorona]
MTRDGDCFRTNLRSDKPAENLISLGWTFRGPTYAKKSRNHSRAGTKHQIRKTSISHPLSTIESVEEFECISPLLVGVAVTVNDFDFPIRQLRFENASSSDSANSAVSPQGRVSMTMNCRTGDTDNSIGALLFFTGIRVREPASS